MELKKYRMIFEDGSWIETLNFEEAKYHGIYVVVEEEINSEIIE
jgi:hypothetical protein